ncbi:MAG: hypothetical protein H8E14_12495 [Candidatus Marinimicrobia bacterium]|nr:hypothetical protein [Candidatus Neomarinimicrobiota bacterium]
MNNCITSLSVLLIVHLLGGCQSPVETVSIKDECFVTLQDLTQALLKMQITDRNNPDFGALECESCNVLHTRAAEAVYPFAVVYKQTGDEKYLTSAKNLGNWLIKQQFPGGEWKETPEEWTGTTTDQLLMMVMAYQIIKAELSGSERTAWETSFLKAADYLTKVMSPDFASINYCATTTATLAMTYQYFPEERYLNKAKELAWQVISKMDEDGFIHAEGDRVYGAKYGADVGYEIDMSLWGLGLYAKLTNDKFIEEKVKASLKNHLYFVYPNGAIDGSWGIRSNKWTMYGSATADGCQILFSMFADQDDRYRTAAIKNLNFLKECIKDGIVGYGPHHWDIFKAPLCIYPTFVRAKNLAMTVAMGEQNSGTAALLPTEEIGMVRHFPTMDVVLVRSKNFMSTVTAYQYKHLKKRNKSKYMHRPAGGSMSHLWVEGHGPLQISSQTEYHRWEPMHFPDLGDTRCLTSRIEFENENGYFTNLYEFDGQLMIEKNKGRALAVVSTSGELSDKKMLAGGVAYKWTHSIYDDEIVRNIKLRYHSTRPEVRIIEPIFQQPGMKFQLEDSRTVLITGENKRFRFEIIQGYAKLDLGVEEEKYWTVYPAAKCYPITLTMPELKEDEFSQEISYRISIVN